MRKPRNSNFFGCRGTLDGSKVALKDMHGHYIVATDRNMAKVTGQQANDEATHFTVQDFGGDDETRTIALKSVHGKWLVADPGNWSPPYLVSANGGFTGPWEKFLNMGYKYHPV